MKYILLLIFTAGEPAAVLMQDPATKLVVRYDTLDLCQKAAAKARADASNKTDPETKQKAIATYACTKVNAP